jgi:TRAP-type C4-dicarboxylate transport system permease small subunit
MLRTILDRLYLYAGYAAGGFLIVIFLLMMGLALGRQVGINIRSGDDFASWCMAAMAFLGLAHTFRSGEMIRVGLLLERLGGRNRWIAEAVALFIGTAFILYFTKQAIQLTYDSWRFNDMSQGIVTVPLWIPQLGFCIGLLVLAIAMVDEMIHVLRGNLPSFEKPKPESPEEFVERIANDGGV